VTPIELPPTVPIVLSTDMIVVHTSIPVAANSYDEAIDVVADLAKQSRQEPGVVRYHATTDVTDEHTIRFFEQYEDESAWEAHAETDHLQQFEARLPELVAGEMETVSVTGGDLRAYTFTTDDLETTEPEADEPETTDPETDDPETTDPETDDPDSKTEEA
jgi:quinol monooxygenase YgiN